MSKTSVTRTVVALCLALAIAGCTKIYRNHGYVPEDEALQAIVVGVDTKESVSESIGTPGASGVLNESAFYYVGTTFEHYAYRAPTPIDREIVAISFSPSGTVSNIERFGLEDGRVIRLSRRVTDSSVADISFLRQLFGSLGNVDLGEFLN